MTNLIKVTTNAKITAIINNGGSFKNQNGDLISVDKIRYFKYAQRAFMGQLSEPMLDRLSSSLAPTDGKVIPSLRINSLIASEDFWCRLIEIYPVIQKFKDVYREKTGLEIWVDESVKDKVVSLIPKIVTQESSPTIEDIPAEILRPETIEEPAKIEELKVSKIEELPPGTKEYKGFRYRKNEDGFYVISNSKEETVSKSSDAKLKSSLMVMKFINELLDF